MLNAEMNLHRPGLTHARRSSRTGHWLRLILLLGVLSGATALAVPIVTGRTSTPRGIRESAEQAVREARQEDASRWAPDRLDEAETALRRGQLALRLEETRLLPFRDFTLARTTLETAKKKATLAREEASTARDSARTDAQAAVSQADEAVSSTNTFAQAMHLSRYERTQLQRSKVLLSEAQILFDQGEYSQAAELADEAVSQAVRVGERAAGEAARYLDPGLVRRWRQLVDATISDSRESKGLAIVVYKENHRLVLYKSGKVVRTYAAEMGYNSVRDKRHAGDAATPEGRYRITSKKGLGQSTYHRALLLDYPNAEDRREFERERRAGRLPKAAKMGGLIEIHGEGGRGKDWTRGCVALSNRDMDELFDRVKVGTAVTIVGGDGSGGVYSDLVSLRRAKERKPQ